MQFMASSRQKGRCPLRRAPFNLLALALLQAVLAPQFALADASDKSQSAQFVEIPPALRTNFYNPVPLHTGNLVAGDISASDFEAGPEWNADSMVFEGRKGDVVSFQLRSEIPTLLVRIQYSGSHTGKVLAEAPARDAPVEFTLPKDGRYYLVVHATGPQRIGPYLMAFGRGQSLPALVDPRAPTQANESKAPGGVPTTEVLRVQANVGLETRTPDAMASPVAVASPSAVPVTSNGDEVALRQAQAERADVARKLSDLRRQRELAEQERELAERERAQAEQDSEVADRESERMEAAAAWNAQDAADEQALQDSLARLDATVAAAQASVQRGTSSAAVQGSATGGHLEVSDTSDSRVVSEPSVADRPVASSEEHLRGFIGRTCAEARANARNSFSSFTVVHEFPKDSECLIQIDMDTAQVHGGTASRQ
jgi:hypothetical protein